MNKHNLNIYGCVIYKILKYENCTAVMELETMAYGINKN